jgi:uncharacterized protein YndB with AHSA1/START domain
MAETKRSPAEDGSAQEAVFTRVFDAPRYLVFQVWTDPKHVAVWWGPTGFTNPVCELDVRPGGAILIHMRAPDGKIYPMTGEYKEIVAPERLMFTSAAMNPEGQAMFVNLNTVTFTERDGKTMMRLHTRVIETTVAFLGNLEEGWNLTLDRLEAHVAMA